MLILVQVISLGDVLKFSLSPSKKKDSLTTNAAGVPLDDRNLVGDDEIYHHFLLPHTLILSVIE